MMKKIFVSIIGTLMISFLMSTPANAKVDGILIKDSYNKYYQYYYDDIKLAAEDNALGFYSPMYNEYLQKSFGVISIKDDAKGYVDYKVIKVAAEDAAVFNQSFSLDKFISSVSGNSIIPVTFDIQQRVVKDGKVVDGEIIRPGQEEFDVLNIY